MRFMDWCNGVVDETAWASLLVTQLDEELFGNALEAEQMAHRRSPTMGP